MVPTKQWRPDRFDARKATSIDWARRNCVGTHCNDPQSHHDMQQEVMADKRLAGELITRRLHALIREAANITGMTYCDPLTQHSLACINSKDVRKSWIQDGSALNLQRVAWMFHYYGTTVHQFGLGMTHSAWVEQQVMMTLNVSYVHLMELSDKQATCLRQLYAQKMNQMRTNIMRRNGSFCHTSMITCEQPKHSADYYKHYKRPKSTFFVTKDLRNNDTWKKVRS